MRLLALVVLLLPSCGGDAASAPVFDAAAYDATPDALPTRCCPEVIACAAACAPTDAPCLAACDVGAAPAALVPVPTLIQCLRHACGPMPSQVCQLDAEGRSTKCSCPVPVPCVCDVCRREWIVCHAAACSGMRG